MGATEGCYTESVHRAVVGNDVRVTTGQPVTHRPWEDWGYFSDKGEAIIEYHTKEQCIQTSLSRGSLSATLEADGS